MNTLTSRRRSTDDEYYHHRFPGSNNIGVHPELGFLGYNFQEKELKRSLSFAYGDTKEPELPQPWVKCPQPYTKQVKQDYNLYKAVCRDLAAVRARLKRASSALFRAKGGRLPTVGEMKECEELATQAMVAANR